MQSPTHSIQSRYRPQISTSHDNAATLFLGQMEWVHNSGFSGLFSESSRQGKTTEKTVQLFPEIVLLFTRIDPWCLFTMLAQTQRPKPVPTSVLVVKNGSKIFGRTDGGMPGPESATAMRTRGGWFG